jgi:RTA1 like protein
LICVTIGPIFLCAAIYLCLSRIIVVYGTHLSRLAPGTIAICFMVSDFISLLLQAGGGAVVEIANDQAVENIGIHLTVAGLSLQVASLALLLCLCADFARRCVKMQKGSGLSSEAAHERIRGARFFRWFLGGE